MYGKNQKYVIQYYDFFKSVSCFVYKEKHL